MIKAVLVEDNVEVAQGLIQIFDKFFPEIKLQAHFINVEDTYKYIKKHKFDWLILDIDLEGNLDGFDLLELVGQPRDFEVLFFTGQTDKIITAVRAQAFDFLPKPISILDIRNAVNRYNMQNSFRKKLSKMVMEPKHLLLEENGDVYVANTHQKTVRIKYSDIIYMHAMGAYTNIIYTNKQNIKCSKNIGTIIDELNSDIFIRIKRSLVINKNHILEIKKFSNKNFLLLLSEGNNLTLSSLIRKTLINML